MTKANNKAVRLQCIVTLSPPFQTQTRSKPMNFSIWGIRNSVSVYSVRSWSRDTSSSEKVQSTWSIWKQPSSSLMSMWYWESRAQLSIILFENILVGVSPWKPMIHTSPTIYSSIILPMVQWCQVTWVLTSFEDLQRHNQLAYLNLSGHVRVTSNNYFPLIAALQR